MLLCIVTFFFSRKIKAAFSFLFSFCLCVFGFSRKIKATYIVAFKKSGK